MFPAGQQFPAPAQAFRPSQPHLVPAQRGTALTITHGGDDPEDDDPQEHPSREAQQQDEQQAHHHGYDQTAADTGEHAALRA